MSGFPTFSRIQIEGIMVQAEPGTRIDQAVTEALALALLERQTVFLRHNLTTTKIEIGPHIDLLEEAYNQAGNED